MKTKNAGIIGLLMIAGFMLSCRNSNKEKIKEGYHDYVIVVSWKNGYLQPVTDNRFSLLFKADDDCKLLTEGNVALRSGDEITIPAKGEAVFKTSKPTSKMLVVLKCGNTNYIATIHLFVMRDGVLYNERRATTHMWNPKSDRLLIDVNNSSRR
jgi:hypothetical protein